jgi:tetratricopeptide (TPR) repeat protein
LLQKLNSIALRIHPCLLLVCLVFAVAGVAHAQETGGDLIGGSGIFRPKNPEAKRSRTPNRPTRPRLDPAELEERFQDALSDGNDARDARKFAAAESAYRAALKLKPRDTRAFQGLGNVLADQQRWDDAEAAYRKAVEFSPVNPDALMALSFVLVQPRSGANAKRFSEAEYYAKRAAQLQPTSAAAFDRVGVALIARGIFNAEAEAALRKALELDPNYLLAQVHLARVLRGMNRGSEADPLYRSAIEKAQDAPTLVLIAEAMQSDQRWSGSEAPLQRALGMDPQHPGALFLLGRLRVVTEKYAEAEPLLKHAVEVNPKFFQARNLLARTYLALARYDDAMTAYNSAVDLASEADRKQLAGVFGFTGVGDGFMKIGRGRDALRAYERGLQVDPSNTALPNKIAEARAGAKP